MGARPRTWGATPGRKRSPLARAKGRWALGRSRSPRPGWAGAPGSARGSQPWRAGVDVRQHDSFARYGKAPAGRPRSAPDGGKPPVRERRGACGNGDHGGTRHPRRVSQERVLETLRLKLCAPQIYPDLTEDNLQNFTEDDGFIFMAITLQQSQAITRVADVIYPFLPGKPHPFADPSLSFPGVAGRLGLGALWPGGSKKSAIIRLLECTLENHPGQFCRLITEIVRAGLRYRSTKTPITREEIEQLNRDIATVGSKIPELWDAKFLHNFPRATSPA